MKIVVLVKHVPDSTADRRFNPDGTTDRESADSRLSELDEYAVEQALQLAESLPDARITYLTMGPEDASEALRRALSMGGDDAVHLLDDALHGSDCLATSRVLAGAVAKLGFDLVLCGMASTDGGGQVVPAMLAERLGVAQATFAGELALDGGRILVRRDGDSATERLSAPLPAVVSVTDRTGEARYPNFKGLMAAKKKPLHTWDLSELGLDPAPTGSATRVTGIAERPARQAGTVIRDDGDAAAQLADYLVAQNLIPRSA
ncbi:electron transfer flavoprotein subunit beta/FixA family protein [Streptomyces lutosisoli]|uniref:Electron transfer flavoprotein subunit beta n=1 Tax=Streptomyces lutosisoli TaxID=2665721 RepID=A0ABW2VVN9_9ACTN